MKVSELMAILANFDPECEVRVFHAETDWAWSGEIGEGSTPYTTVTWALASPMDVGQRPDGSVNIGLDERI